MIIDEYGLPIDQGATDAADSARLAGMMALIKHPKAPDLCRYFIDSKPVRHPFANTGAVKENDPKTMSRDQLVPLSAGLLEQGYILNWDDIFGFRFPNGDLKSPAVWNHFKMCSNTEPRKLGFWWLEKLDLQYNAWALKRWQDGLIKHPPEQNQLISICHTATKVTGFNWLRAYKNSSPHLASAIYDYWVPWREPDKEVFEGIIDMINKA